MEPQYLPSASSDLTARPRTRSSRPPLPPSSSSSSSSFSKRRGLPPLPPPAPRSVAGSPSPSLSRLPATRPQRQPQHGYECHHQRPRVRRRRRCAELAGGTAADCAAICCCCPCAVLNLLVLAVVRLPAGLCRKAIRRRRMGKMMSAKTGLLQRGEDDDDESWTTLFGHGSGWTDADDEDESTSLAEMEEIENEMWERFQGTGFWRSPSTMERGQEL